MTNARKIPELLAPAGGMEQLRAALRFGADAVYGGMKHYGLRAFAGNFDAQELAQAVELCHRQGKKFYVTMNIFPFDDQLPGFVEAARQAWEIGVDAAIVSDLGAICTLREQVPGLALHVSTQASTVNAPSVRHHRDLGCRRVILAREMSLSRLAALGAAVGADMELETFVHGASCVAWSGRCLLSAALTGRSGNQGACAQPCRWEYAVMEKKRPGEYLPVCEDENGSYLFSARDLNLMPLLPQLTAAGISSLKIEGRMKTEYYVATVVSAYRRALDALAQGEETFQAALPGLLAELDCASHRDSDTGFLLGTPQQPGGAEGFHQSAEYIARVMTDADDQGIATVQLKNRFYAGDRLEVLQPGATNVMIAPKFRKADTGEEMDTYGVAGTLVKMQFPFPVAEGDLIRGVTRNHRR
ncbi:MAG TPA: U32 family peptidase [Candidatus Egerieenecus merdigallinarum]|nr:U32 family peptidase [Candidatus Egerieenecus merdigallinarum]